MKDQIYKIMEAEGLSPAKFADEIGVQRSSISHIISGRNKPSYDFIIKILGRFSGINAEWLLTGKGSMIKSSGKADNTGAKQSSLFDQPIKNSVEREKNLDYKSSNESADALRLSYERSSSTEKDTKKQTEQKSTEIGMFTNVNKVKYLLIIYEDGAFEQFMPR